ncbi:MAG: GntR family transcriptional regulator [Pseudomonadota bacterium]
MSTNVAHNSGRPKYAQVADLLLDRIASGALPDGARLPPERELAKDLDIAVGTLRKALQVLNEQDVITRVQGSGNYVSARGVRSSIYSMFRLELITGGGLPGARVLSVSTQAKSDDLPAFGAQNVATRIRRVRTLSNQPVALEEIWLDASVGTLARADLGEALYLTYQTRLGIWISHVEDRVTLASPPDWAIDVCDMQLDTQTGYVERLSWKDTSTPIEFSRTWFDTKRAVYVQRMT